MTILIVEDDRDLAELIKEKVENCGYATVCVYSAGESLEWLARNTPYIMILDYSLPDMNAKDFIAHLEKTELPLPPFIVSTGQGDEIIAVEMMKLGARDYVLKDSHFLEMLPEAIRRVGREIESETRLKLAEAALQKSDEIFNQFMLHSPIYVFFKDAEIRSIKLSANYENFLGKPMTELIGKNMEDLFPSDFAKKIVEDDIRILKEGKVIAIDEDFNGRNYSTIKFPFQTSDKTQYLAGFTLDITERKQAEAEREKLQAQLSQSQKMESVGRLAGGVAHDFNNMLGVILGHTEMALKQADPTQPIFTALQEIQKAAERSADLTRQLLAFARKQTIVPMVLDLNATVAGMLKMLERLIGEDIKLTWLPGKDLLPVKLDPSQIDQILANLCVNARDAIQGVGKVIIETATVAFDQHYCTLYPEFIPGEYVMLAVSDSGCGMNKDTMDRLFEPFFTTKELGKGTGLGLATVYGIVKQNNGFINVYSEPGHGTTFKIYLPRHVSKAEGMTKESPVESVTRGQETILLVEDEVLILKVTRMILEHIGYTVLAASTPGEAIQLAREHHGEMHLLMTDVIMPEMNGRDLAKNLLTLYPHLKCLFMSGYTADVIGHHGMLDEGVHFIQKPFSIKDLAAKVREALDTE